MYIMFYMLWIHFCHHAKSITPQESRLNNTICIMSKGFISTKKKEKMEQRGLLEDKKHKAHCLILPYPLIGHLNPMLQFSKRLHHEGIRITIAMTRHLFKTSRQFSGPFSVETISDGFDEGRGDVPSKTYTSMFEKVGGETLSELLLRLKDSGRPVDCLIYNPFLPWAVVVAKKFGLVTAAFFTQSNSVNKIYYHVYNGDIKLPVSEKETKTLNVPGLPPLGFTDLPSFICCPEKVPNAINLVLNQFKHIEEVDYVFVNTVYEMEEEVTELMRKLWPVKTVGPTIPSMYLDKRLSDDREYGLSIFKPASDCMKWLEERSSRSVVYVSFGTIAQLRPEQIEELALGLEMTDKNFLWVVRSSEESKLPKDFKCEKGIIVSWCPQLEVLAHEAIGCFVTHCGWNSTLEAMSQGVPMVAIPWWSDQSTNGKFVVDVWKMGIKAQAGGGDVVGRDEIVRCVKYVMEGETGEDIKKNARKWKEIFRQAVDDGGSSDRNIEDFVSHLALASN